MDQAGSSEERFSDIRLHMSAGSELMNILPASSPHLPRLP
jgi:hypothetical protein